MLTEFDEDASVLFQNLERALGASFVAGAEHLLFFLLIVNSCSRIQGRSVTGGYTGSALGPWFEVVEHGKNPLVDTYAQRSGDSPCALYRLISALDVVRKSKGADTSSGAG